MGATKPVALWAATETTFGTDPTTGYVRVPQADLALPDTLGEIVKMPVQMDTFGPVTSVVGAQGGAGINFKTPIYGLASAGDGSTDCAAPTWLTALMKACGWTEVVGKTATAAVGSTSTSLVLTTGHGARFAVGDVVGWVSSGSLYAAEITNIATDTLTVAPALPGSPANSDVIYHAATYKPPTAGVALADAKTASLYVEGDSWRFVFSGCAGTVKLAETTAKGMPMLEWSFSFDRYATTDYNLASTPPAQTPLIARAGRLVYNATATAVSAFSFDPGLTVAEQASVSGTHGRAGFYVTDAEATATAKPYQATTYLTDADAAAERVLFAQLGTASLNGFALYAHRAQLTKRPSVSDINGIRGHDLAFQVNRSASTTIPNYVWALI